ncbi:hypothetical protein [Nocardia sp. bgisy134]|uniref:hypothetical protein n=1 Tax=Nocardia sp. bgisy134 TaxID=3413789 RepID=UPI003D74731B
MGGLWWWVHARSARDIVETFAETVVVEDPGRLADAPTWELTEVDIDDRDDLALQELRAQRESQ